MGHSISEAAMKFGFSRTSISQVYRKYRESGKTSNLRHHCGRKKIMLKRDQRRLTRIIKRDRRATLTQLLQISMQKFAAMGHQQVSACEPFNET
ncbi:hypothetical protein AVEN_117868-1 [Araneus ventricosus]|uniref:Insertion element IS150 protein InsJ-like helix-turn-helix domain-containing protein n=1 Tax=Araneus ventricosus TaxID=182803 RepID=A0A4Y2MZE3_ARAVE|nr:hypothetical protein AVEN_117868-1 [Araneus ventricosus]